MKTEVTFLFMLLSLVASGCFGNGDNSDDKPDEDPLNGTIDLNTVNLLYINVTGNESLSWNWSIIPEDNGTCNSKKVHFILTVWGLGAYASGGEIGYRWMESKLVNEKTCEHSGNVTIVPENYYELTWEGIVTIEYHITIEE